MLPCVVAPASQSSYSLLKLIHNKQMHGSRAKTHPSFRDGHWHLWQQGKGSARNSDNSCVKANVLHRHQYPPQHPY